MTESIAPLIDGENHQNFDSNPDGTRIVPSDAPTSYDLSDVLTKKDWDEVDAAPET